MTLFTRVLTHAFTASVGLLAGCAWLNPPPDAAALMARAQARLGSTTLQTIAVSGLGSDASVGQAHAPGGAWPQVKLKALSRSMHFGEVSFREEFIRTRAEAQGGGALPLLDQGDARGVGLARATFAWDVVAVDTVPAPAAWQVRMHDLWLTTPQGALKAAERYGARAGARREGLRFYDTLSFEVPGQFSAALLMESDGRVVRIESILPQAVLGDMPVLTEFSGYQQRGNLLFPSRIVQRQGVFPALDLVVGRVAADETVDITVPENVRSAVGTVTVEKLAEGVWWLGGGSHHSVAIEQAAQVVLVEAPLDDSRARAVLAAVRKLVPGKPVQTVINTHHHFDHAGGLRVAAAEGITLITSALAKPYFDRVLAQPATRVPDPLGETAKPPRIVGVAREHVLDDAGRRVEIHELQDSIHARGLLVVWLPGERLLIEADAYTPGPPGAAPPTVANANHLNLVQNLDRLKLAPLRIVPLHGRVVPASELYAQVGRTPPP